MKHGERSAGFLLFSLVAGTLLSVSLPACMGSGVQKSNASGAGMSIYELSTTTLEGEELELSQFQGKVTLAVNVASRCGMTPQYEGLQSLHEEFGEKGFAVLGFPSNDFMGQEPGSPLEIREFCQKNYGVTFPMFSKRKVKGDEKDEVYAALTRELDEPDWNFTKYLLGRDGHVLARFGPRVTPESEELRSAILDALAAAP